MSIRRTLLVGSVLLLSVGWLLPPGSLEMSGEGGPLAFRVTLSDSALEAMEGLGLQIPVKGRFQGAPTPDRSPGCAVLGNGRRRPDGWQRRGDGGG